MSRSTPKGFWTPHRNGKYYCSRGCGGGKWCLHADYVKAKAAAAALCKLLGPAWQPRVWENLGWHYSAVLKMPKAYGEPPEVSGPDYPGGGYLCIWNGPSSFTAQDKDPRKALVKVYAQAHRQTLANTAVVEAMMGRVGIPMPARRLRG